MDNKVVDGVEIVSRENSILGIPERSSKYYLTEAEEENIKKKKDKIEYINNEIDRRRTSFEIV